MSLVGCGGLVAGACLLFILGAVTVTNHCQMPYPSTNNALSPKSWKQNLVMNEDGLQNAIHKITLLGLPQIR